MKIRDSQWILVKQGAWLLTPNLRLARELNLQYAQWQTAHGEQVWEKPNIAAIDVWIQELWSGALHAGFVEHALLTPAQSAFLWESVISSAVSDINAASVVAAAEDAYRLCYQWQVECNAKTFSGNENSSAFAIWFKAFEKEADARGFIALPKAMAQLVTLAKNNQVPRIQTILTAGFDGLAPLYSELLHAVVQTVQEAAVLPCQATLSKVKAPTAYDEIKNACDYARHVIENNKDARVAIIVPDLTARRELIERIVFQVFVPQALMPHNERCAPPFNFSAGEPLMRIPLVRTALNILSLTGKAPTLAWWQDILKSPFIKGFKEEWLARGMLAARLQNEAHTYTTLKWVITLTAQKFTPRPKSREREYKYEYACVALNSVLQALQAQTGSLKKRLPSAWHDYFLSCLRAAGFTEGADITSVEYQQREQFLAQLEQLQTFDALSGEISHAEALKLVRRWLQKGVFQPQTKRSPLQVLGVLEGAGLEFTHTWVAGMNDTAWPPAPKPNPFIPYDVQRGKNMPHATAEREYAFVETLFEQYKNSCGEMVVSYAEKEAENALRESALIKHIPTIESTNKTSNYTADVFSAKVPLERIEDTDTLALQKDEITSGGTALLRDQSACAFRAFVQHRLKVRELPEPEEGLNSMQRGNLLHECMENIWNTLKSQSTLLNLSEDDLRALVNKVVFEATEKHIQTAGAQFIDVERQRLCDLVLAWLEVEKTREPFTVLHTEHDEKIGVGPLSIRVKVDRIDEVGDNEHIVIDYKTSKTKPSIKKWQTDRPEDPQLPLYAVGGEWVRGIYFAHVKIKEPQFVGASDQNRFIPMKNQNADWSDWDAALKNWRQVLNKLATDFAQGSASIAPRNKGDCEYCTVAMVCRKELEGLR